MKRKIVFLRVLVVIIIVSSIIGCQSITLQQLEVTEQQEKEVEESSSENEAVFEIRMLDVGQGLAVLIKSDEHYMIYDGGGRKYSSYVVSYLKQHKITSLDYMFVSHYDEDHINGLVGVLNTTTIDKTITPDYETDSQIYQSFRNMLSKNGSKEIHPSVGDSYQLGNSIIEVLSPGDYNYDSENNYSIVIKIAYDDFSCIITGDADKEVESDLLKSSIGLLKSDIYVVGHHGSSSSSSEAFVKAISPEYAFISVGSENSYGHPTESTLNILNENNCEIYRTDKHGEITAYYDGKNTWISTNGQSDISEISSDTTEYVININSKKFHYSNCSSIEKMSNGNKVLSDKSREELIAEGYLPCGLCKP